MKYCSRCRTENKDEAIYCNKCGEQFSVNQSQISEYPSKSYPQSNYQDYQYPIKINKKFLVVMIFVIVVLVLVIISAFLPWYTLVYKGAGSGSIEGESIYFKAETKGDYYFTELKTTTTTEATGDYEDYEYDIDSTDYGNEDIKNTMNNTLYIIIAVIIIGIITILIFIVIAFQKLPKSYGILIFSIFTILIAIVLIYFTIALPSSISEYFQEKTSSEDFPTMMSDIDERYNRQFFGSTSYEIPFSDITGTYESTGSLDIDISWGGGFSWFIMIICLILSLIGLASSVLINDR